MRRVLLLAACLLACPVLGACQGGGSKPDGQRGATFAATETPMRFRRFRALLGSTITEATRGSASAVRARGPSISHEGLALIKATLPHDVARTDVPRYLEGRARFGDALKGWVTAVDSGTDAQLIEALMRLDAETRGWIDAYMGREPETSI